MTKPREWWINIFSRVVLENAPPIGSISQFDMEIINVIEKSAYDELQTKFDIAVEALEFYATHWRADVYTGPVGDLLKDFGHKAREALAKIKDETVR